MKRVGLSVWVVGLGLTVAHAAAAAPDNAAPDKIAQADPQPPAPVPEPEPTSPPPPEPTGTDPSVPTSTPSPPASDTPTPSAVESSKKPARRPFAGSSLYVSNSMTTNTIFRGQTLYADPTVESSVYVLPRYAIDDAWQIRGRLIVSYEYTNSDTTTLRNEPLLSDLGLSLYYRGIAPIAKIKPNLFAGVSLPTSKVSQSRTMIFSPSVGLQLSRAFDHVLGGDATVVATGGYSHPIYRSANPEVTDPRPAGAFSCVGGNNCQDLLSGSMNPSDTLTYSLIAEMEWGKWSPAILYLGATQWAYHPPAATNPVDGTPVSSPVGFNPTSVRQTHYLSVWLDYNFNSWFTGEVGFWNAVNAIDGDGQRSSILFDRYQDTRVFLGFSFQLDNLVRRLQGGGEGEPGIVHTRNERPKQPVMGL